MTGDEPSVAVLVAEFSDANVSFRRHRDREAAGSTKVWIDLGCPVKANALNDDWLGRVCRENQQRCRQQSPKDREKYFSHLPPYCLQDSDTVVDGDAAC